MIDLADIKENLSDVLTDYFNNEKFDLKPGSLFVVGCSTSMIRGEWMGTDSALSIGKAVYETLQAFLKPRKIDLAIHPVAFELGVGFAPARKKGKLPRDFKSRASANSATPA